MKPAMEVKPKTREELVDRARFLCAMNPGCRYGQALFLIASNHSMIDKIAAENPDKLREIDPFYDDSLAEKFLDALFTEVRS